ncbi:MAG: dephospho-CoA kinase [Paracoccaceae bacterium]
MIKLGLTGSIGAGKSTTAAMFADAGVPVWDADAAVHALYAGGPAVRAVEAAFPGATAQGVVDRAALSARLHGAQDFARLEGIVHPLLAADRHAFLSRHADARAVLFDIPLLFETGADDWLDAVIVVTVDEATQARRVLSRPGMTRARLDAILARQMPDAEKRARADHVIVADTLAGARARVAEILETL